MNKFNFNDIVRIRKVALSNHFEITFEQAQELWKDYSDSHSSEWLQLPPTSKILWNIIKWRVEKLSK